MALAAIILGLFAYGGYKRQQRQVAALAEGNTPRNVSPATAAGVDIAKDIPTGNLPNASTLRGAPSESGTLVPPGELQAGQAGATDRRRSGRGRTGLRAPGADAGTTGCRPDPSTTRAIS